MTENTFQAMQASSYLSGGNAAYIEELYETFLKDPDAVAPEWRNYFQSLPTVNGANIEVSHADIRNYFLHAVKQPRVAVATSTDALHERKQANVERLIAAYRRYGHLAAKIDPLGTSRAQVPELQLDVYDLSSADFNTQFRAIELTGTTTASLQEIVTRLQTIYCDTIGFEYDYINDPAELKWLRQRIEKGRPSYSADEKRKILQQLIAADGLERYLSTKYVGQKRFSLEGGDTLIPVLQQIVHQGSSVGIKGMVLCMPHRGRLNVLLNVIGQSPEELFQEFEGRKDYGMTSGDVKYHLGFSSDVKTAQGSIHLSLEFNPSHLEIVSPVAMGAVRSRQERRNDETHTHVMPVMMHGDAAFAGQGVVMETLNMSQTRAYFVGGSVHVVVNNQIGFTTVPEDSRSTLYCTDVAKMIEAPVFHVNGDDPEAAAWVAQLAVDYRMQFRKDVVIDLVCFRRLGHNEADEPAATQPLMYQKIRAHEATREIYAKQLINENVCTQEDVDHMINDYRDALDRGQQIIATVQNASTQERATNWSKYIGKDWNTVVNTAVSMDRINKLAKELNKLPKGFVPQRQVGQMLQARIAMNKGDQSLDWGAAEILAYASLLVEGTPIRICGQDCRRGTFAHRHAVLHDNNTGTQYIPLQNLQKQQAKFEIYDSILSEEAALAFEYGYAATDPKPLVVWEAQFGDFVNGAQVVIDQFLSSGEQKWKRLCGLVLLLPHGYEGQGPEHSSARLERYLQLCAENNMQVCVPSTPAQIFHLLRRQILRPYRKPLIVMTPKSLLRHKLAVSALDELTDGKFQLVITETDTLKNANVKRVVLCSGKVYYDLLTKRRETKQNDIAIIRIEQLYPFPHDELKAQLARYKNAKEVVWCQEEPENQGAWLIILHHLKECLAKAQTLNYVGRKSSAAPAVGYAGLHAKQQAEIVIKALNSKLR